MFIQVITGRATDVDAFKRQGDKWERDVRPGAAGFLGSTAGVTADGRFVVFARFESEDAAKKNNDRPEQDAWWRETAQYFEGVEFKDSAEVVTILGGGKDDAGFVQVMLGHITDADKLAELRKNIERMEKEMAQGRPDVIGEVIAVHGDGTSPTRRTSRRRRRRARTKRSRCRPTRRRRSMTG
jgi:hypothetical protein